MKKQRVKALLEVSLMVAFLSVISQIAIPTVLGVPITLQIFAVALIGYLLGTKKSLLTIAIYISLGIIGIPVFSSFGGGFFHLMGYTAGFILGFVPLTALCSIRVKRLKIPLGIFGTFICHFIGASQYSFVGKVPLLTSLITMSLPYILKDILLVVLAYFVAEILKKRIKIN